MAQISAAGIIILCILAAGIVLLISWAIGHRVMHGNEDGDREGQQIESGFTQYEYMRDLRERNKENLAAAWTRGSKRPRQQSVPLSTTDLSGQSYSHY